MTSFLKSTRETHTSSPRTWIFGYGSLTASCGINGRQMRRVYRERDLTECHLNGYVRSFNASYQSPWISRWAEFEDLPSARYFGIERAPGHRVNGIVFELAPRDWRAFKMSEGGDSIYWFRDVTVDMILPLGFLRPGDRVLTCATKSPTKSGFVTMAYRARCQDALNQRSQSFRDEFGTIESYLP